MNRHQQIKKPKGLCLTDRCTKHARKSRNYCHCCAARKFAISNPICYAFNNLKQNAKRRGHDFSLTLEQFRNWHLIDAYMEGKGKTSTSMSIDRRDNDQGYHIDNIQLLTLAGNTRKRYVPYYQENPY